MVDSPGSRLVTAVPDISIVVPLYNEDKVFDQLVHRLTAVAESSPETIEFVLVDDGSRDLTAARLHALAMSDRRFKAVFLSRNHGHQIAVSAGMTYASASKAVMIIDGDLQDPPEMVSAFFAKIKEGYDVVYAIREQRKENILKRAMYWSFYRLLRSISDTDLPVDSGDFCMMTRRVNAILVSMPERSRFVRGLRTWVGFKQTGIAYERAGRQAGDSKYSMGKLFQLAYDGIFNFSFVPLRLISRLGLFTIVISLIYLSYVFFKKIMGYPMPSGFTALIVAISMFSGVQLISLGIIGEYVSRIYLQVKNRPLFIVNKVIADMRESDG